SSTLPSLLLRMFGHAEIHDGVEVLDVGTGCGYGAALLARRLGDDRVTSVDVDPYLTKAAAERLDLIGLHPRIVTADATGPLTGEYDRIVARSEERRVGKAGGARWAPYNITTDKLEAPGDKEKVTK